MFDLLLYILSLSLVAGEFFLEFFSRVRLLEQVTDVPFKLLLQAFQPSIDGGGEDFPLTLGELLNQVVELREVVLLGRDADDVLHRQLAVIGDVPLDTLSIRRRLGVALGDDQVDLAAGQVALLDKAQQGFRDLLVAVHRHKYGIGLRQEADQRVLVPRVRR